MQRIARLAGTVAGVVAAAAAVGLAGPAVAVSAARPAPDGPLNMVQRVEVPVDDVSSEALQMAVAMVFGAAVATAVRRRPRRAREPERTPTGARLIELEPAGPPP